VDGGPLPFSGQGETNGHSSVRALMRSLRRDRAGFPVEKSGKQPINRDRRPEAHKTKRAQEPG